MSGPRRCRRYEKAQKPLAAFEADIRRYADLAQEVLGESAAEAIQYLHVDCGPLKQARALSQSSTCAHAALLCVGQGFGRLTPESPSSRRARASPFLS